MDIHDLKGRHLMFFIPTKLRTIRANVYFDIDMLSRLFEIFLEILACHAFRFHDDHNFGAVFLAFVEAFPNPNFSKFVWRVADNLLPEPLQ
jgi:hypothetical protein